jgi:LmbE family N-acetylglucosaminyl deacetylase
VATVVFLHAHPDDEAITTAATMAGLADDSHRVVLVLATRGELGEVPDGFLDEHETLAERRVTETRAAADILGVARVEFLGFRDSGMIGEPTNDEPGSFWSADVDEAATLVADILREEAADVLVHYDDHGAYGHPDHIQVHRVGTRAVELAGTPREFHVTINRDRFLRGLEGAPTEFDLALGLPESEITHAVAVGDRRERKLAAMRAHASQIAEDSWFLTMSEDLWQDSFGYEWYARVGTKRAGPWQPNLLD